MKRRALPILLMILLLAGCASEEKHKVQDNQAQIEDSQESSGADKAQTESAQDDAEASQEAEQAPYVVTFEATTIEGEPFTSDCFADSKLTMINVWATYCNPCLSEMPDLGEIANSYDGADFQMIGIISDVTEDAEDGIATAKELIAETNADYPHLLLNQSLYTNLVGGVSAVPTTFFVNQKGEALGYLTGAQSKEAWESLINELLAEMD